MLNSVNLNLLIKKEEYKQRIDTLELRMGELQRQCRELKIPIVIVVEGLEISGKGIQIGKLMKALDPRGFRVHSMQEESKEEQAYPFLWRYWNKLPEAGKITIFDGSWYRKVTVELFDKLIARQDMSTVYEEIHCFEQQLIDADTCLVKLFLYVTQEEQKKRMEELLAHKSTAWRVSKNDLKKNKQYEAYQVLVNEVLNATNTDCAPWNVISTVDRRSGTVQLYQVVIRALEEKVKEKNRLQILEESRSCGELRIESNPASFKMKTSGVGKFPLSSVDLSNSLTDDEYENRLKKLQKKIGRLHGELYRQKIPMIIGFEGWDAAGKGGAIRRLTEKLDPRGYAVHTVASPTPEEKSHHYLWRFWKNVPKNGHIALFDRTWYGRVMVERIEGFCKNEEWQRAYKEMNDMETSFVNQGAIVLKFWIHIDKDEQKRRFEARQNTPEKQWKITEEDWRNREKWDQYEVVVNEMIDRTSTEEAPWIVIEGNDKKYARIKVLETVIEAMEKRLK
ncbi:MAG: polyphosphate:AMP phosphotransferase [Eubacteriales bacterium]